MTDSKIKLVGDLVLLDIPEAPEKTSGGIFIPEVSRERGCIGTVKHIGDGVKFIKVGDKVLFEKTLVEDFYFDKVKYGLVRETEIYGILEDE